MKRRILSVITALALCLGLCPTWALAADGVTYLDENGDTQNCPTAISVAADTTAWETGWYVVDSDVEIADRITVNGAVSLILTNGCSLTAQEGIALLKGNSLTIYAQSTEEAAMGALTATTSDIANAGIGGNGLSQPDSGAVTINGGRITATSMNAAGIGGSTMGACGAVTINGGIVKATGGGRTGAGIGASGSGWTNELIKITGGTVTATGGSAGISSNKGAVMISGGSVTATGKNGCPGIGSTGSYAKDSGTIEISGGTVTATGGEGADAIGNRSGVSGTTVTISGGTVMANPTGEGGNPFPTNAGATTISGGVIKIPSQGGGEPVEAVAMVSWADRSQLFDDIEYAWGAACRARGTDNTPKPAAISLLKDVALKERQQLNIAEDPSSAIDITLNGNGYSITGDSVVMSLSAGKVTINDCTIKSTVTENPAVGVSGNATLTINSGGIISAGDDLNVLDDGTVTLYGGTFQAERDVVFSDNTSLYELLGSIEKASFAFYDDKTPIDLTNTKNASGNYVLRGNGKTFTVGECKHPLGTIPDPGDCGKHSLVCPACGCDTGTEPCALTFSGNFSDQEATCQKCKATYTVWLSRSGDFIYNGKAHEFDVTVKYSAPNSHDVELVQGTNYSVTYENNENAGDEASVALTFNGSTAPFFTKTFTIDKATPTVAWAVPSATVTYGFTQEQLPKVNIKLVGDEQFTDDLKPHLSYSYTGSSTGNGIPQTAGTYQVIAKLEAFGNYRAVDSAPLNLTINKSTPTIEFKETFTASKTYDKSPFPTPEETDLTITGAQFSDVEFSWKKADGTALSQAPSNAGSYILTASIPDSANVTGTSATVTVTINKAQGSVEIDRASLNKEYDGKPVAPKFSNATGTVTVQYQNLVTGTPPTTEAPTKAGLYQVLVEVAESDNYNATPNRTTCTISKRTVEIEWGDTEFTYTGQVPPITATVMNKVGNDDVTVIVVAYNSDVGRANEARADDLGGKDKDNYTLLNATNKTTTYTIKQATPVPPTVIVEEPDTIYDSTDISTIKLVPAPGYTLPGTIALKEGQTLVAGTKFYDCIFTPTDQHHYTTVDCTVQLTVEKDELTSIEVTNAPTKITYTYGESFDKAGMAITATYASGATKDVTGEVEISPETLTVATTALTITYQEKSVTQAITVNPKTVTASVTVKPDSYVYTGEAITPDEVVVKDGETVIPSTEYEVSYSNNVNVGDAATVTITDNAGGNYTVSGTAIFTITAKSLTGAKVEVTGTFTYTGNAQKPTPTVTLDGKTLTANTDYTVAYADNTDAGTAKITVTGTGNYSDEASGTFTIDRATLTVEGTGTASGTYGAKLSELAVSGLTAKLGEATVTGTWKLAGGTVPNVGDSGEYTATFTPATGADNYNPLTAKVKLDIAKADYTGTKTASTSAKFGTTGTYDLSALLPDGATAGTAATTSDIFEGTPAVSGKTLTYKLAADAAVDSTGTITVPVTSANYNDFNLTITVTVTDKEVPTLTVSPITVTYSGEAVPGTAIKGTAKVGDATVPGTWSFTEGQALTNVTDSGTKAVKFVPTDQGTYAEATGTVVVTIGKATPTGAPKYTAISTSGKTLADAGLTTEGGTFSTTGTVAWTLAGTTEVTANTAYEWTFTPSDTANYNTLTGNITLWPYTAPSDPGGGGSYVPSGPGTPSTPSTSLPVTTTGQGSTTTTTAAPNASTQGGTATTTINTAMGQEIIKQAVANKSEDVVIAPKVTGSVTKAEVSIPASTVGQIRSQTNASLTISTPVADVTIPNGGLGSLSSAGGAVTVTAEQTGNTVELTVTAGGQTIQNVPGGVTLTVPAVSTTPGTVAVLVHPDGTREVVRKSVADGNSVTIPLNGSAKIEIVDNGKVFNDVPTDNWAADAVAFASSHELFNGTSDTTFSPNLPMSRGMLAVVLHNLESNPDAVLGGAFSDVSNSKWYAEGVSWAAAKGIITGYGNGMFGPDDDITREQLAVMLWRYAGSPAATDKELQFADAGKASGYALDALRWAVGKGIINGKGNGILDPGGKATRAETAQMLKNFLERK